MQSHKNRVLLARTATVSLIAAAACQIGLVKNAQAEQVPQSAALQAKLAANPSDAITSDGASSGAQMAASPTSEESLHQVITGATNSNSFGGFIDNPTAGTVTAYVTPSAVAGVRQALSSAGVSDLVSVVPVQNTSQTLSALVSLIETDRAQIKAAGIDMTEWYPDIASNTVNVQVTSDVQAAQAYMTNAYGAGLITVTQGTSGSLSLTATRLADTVPYFDGDRIVRGGVEACTSNYEYTGNNSGNPFQLTAGHCGSGSFTQNGTGIGSTSTNYYTGGGLDVQSITCVSGFTTCNGDGFVWYGTGSTQSKEVTQQCSSGGSCAVGDLVAADGSYSQEVDDNKIQWINGCFGGECGLTEAINQNGVDPLQAGDSGGPVYQNKGGGVVWADGLNIGFDTSNPTHMFYLGMSEIMSLVNGTLILY